MASVNRVTLIGAAGRDAEMRSIGNGTVTNASIATTRNWKNRESGERQEETEWHRLVFYDRLAEVAGEYLKKGKSVYIEGRLKTRKWQDKEGRDQYTTEIVVEKMELLGGRDAGSREGGSQERSNSSTPSSRPQQPQRSAPARQPVAAGGFDETGPGGDDDIPW